MESARVYYHLEGRNYQVNCRPSEVNATVEDLRCQGLQVLGYRRAWRGSSMNQLPNVAANVAAGEKREREERK